MSDKVAPDEVDNTTKDVIQTISLEDSITIATNFGSTFIISGLLAAKCKTVVAPFERIKLILQTQASSHQMEKANKVAYKGFIDALLRIPKEQGFFSLWRGNYTNICRYVPMQAINFSLYELLYTTFVEVIEPSTRRREDIIAFITGGIVGVTSCVLLYPLTLCATRIAVDVGDGKQIKREFRNLSHCLTKIYHHEGIRGFYVGLPSSAVGMFLYRSAYFGLYTSGQRCYSNSYSPDRTTHTLTAPVFVSFALAQFASTSATLVSYPFDTICRQTMLRSGQGLTQRVTAKVVTHRILRTEGVLGLYRGVLANLFTATSGSVILVSYDIVKGYYRKLRNAKKERGS